MVPGDLFVLHPGLTPDDDLEAIAVAIEQGATVIVASRVVAEDPGLDPAPDPVALSGILPREVPLIRVEESMAMGARLAAAFYGACLCVCAWGGRGAVLDTGRQSPGMREQLDLLGSNKIDLLDSGSHQYIRTAHALRLARFRSGKSWRQEPRLRRVGPLEL